MHMAEIRVKAAIETNLQFHTRFFNGFEGTVNAFEVKINRFFTKNMFACRR